MKTLLIITTLILFAAIAGHAQTAEPTPCAENCVTISRAAALTAVQNAAKVVALEKESEAKDKALEAYKDEVNALRVKIAEQSGELSGIKQNAVSDRAIITVLLQSVKKKCLFSLCL